MANNLAQIVERANTLFAKNKYKQAQKYYEQALRLSPADPTLNFNLGVVFQVQNQDEKAIALYEKAPNLADAQNNLGIIYKKRGELDKAQSHYQTALNLDPNHKDAKDNLKLLKQENKPSNKKAEEPKPLANQIPEKTKEAIRATFTYQGLVNALDSKIITKDDIESQASFEQDNPNLLTTQRIHTVLLSDLETGQVKRKESPKPQKSLSSSPRSPQKNDQAQLLVQLQEKMGPNFKPGWQGIDSDGDLIELAALTDDGWLRFEVEKVNGTKDAFAYPLDKFLAELKENPLYPLSPEEAQGLKNDNLEKLDEQGQANLLQKIYNQSLAELQDIRANQRQKIENLLKKDEQKKIKQTLSNIRSS